MTNTESLPDQKICEGVLSVPACSSYQQPSNCLEFWMRHNIPTTVYILQCLIEAVRNIRALSFGPCTGSLAAAVLLRNRLSRDSAIVANREFATDASEARYGVLGALSTMIVDKKLKILDHLPTPSCPRGN